MRIRIVSKGSPQNTHVVDAATGERIENVVAVEWRCCATTGEATAKLTVFAPEVDLVADVQKPDESAQPEPPPSEEPEHQ